MFDEDNRGVLTWAESSSLLKSLGMPELNPAFLREARCPVDQTSAAGLAWSDLNVILNSSAFQRLHSFNYNRHGSEYNAKCIRKALELLTRPKLGIGFEDIKQLRMSFFLYEGDAPHGIELDKKTIQSTMKLAGKMVAPRKIDTWLLFGFRPQVPKRMQLYEIMDLLKYCVVRPSMMAQASPFDLVGIDKTKDGLYDLVESDAFMHPDERLARKLNQAYEVETRRMIMGEMDHDTGPVEKRAATKFVDKYTKKLRQQQRDADRKSAKNTKLFKKIHANVALSQKELRVSRTVTPRDPEVQREALRAGSAPRSRPGTAMSTATSGTWGGASSDAASASGSRPGSAMMQRSDSVADNSGGGYGNGNGNRAAGTPSPSSPSAAGTTRRVVGMPAPRGVSAHERPQSVLRDLEGPDRRVPSGRRSAYRRPRGSAPPRAGGGGADAVSSRREALARAQDAPRENFEAKVARMSGLIAEEMRFVPESTEKDIIIDDPNIDYAPDMGEEEVIRQQERVFEPKPMSRHLRQKPAQFPNQQEYFGDPEFSLRPRPEEDFSHLNEDEWEEYQEMLRARRDGQPLPESAHRRRRRNNNNNNDDEDDYGYGGGGYDDSNSHSHSHSTESREMRRERDDAEVGVYTDRAPSAMGNRARPASSGVSPSLRRAHAANAGGGGGAGGRRAKSAHPGHGGGSSSSSAPGPFQVRIEQGPPRPPSGRDYGARSQSARGALQRSHQGGGNDGDGLGGDGRGGLPVALTAGRERRQGTFDEWESLRVKYANGRRHPEFHRRAKSAIMSRALAKRNKHYVLMPEIKDPTRKEKRERERIRQLTARPKTAKERLREERKRKAMVKDIAEVEKEEREGALQALLRAHEERSVLEAHGYGSDGQIADGPHAHAGGDGNTGGNDTTLDGLSYGSYSEGGSYTYSDDNEADDGEDGFSQLSEDDDGDYNNSNNNYRDREARRNDDEDEVDDDDDDDDDNDDIAMYEGDGYGRQQGGRDDTDGMYESHPRSSTAVPRLRLDAGTPLPQRPQTSMGTSPRTRSVSRAGGRGGGGRGGGGGGGIMDMYIDRLLSTRRGDGGATSSSSAGGSTVPASGRPGTASTATVREGGFIASLPVSPVRKARAKSARASQRAAAAGAASYSSTPRPMSSMTSAMSSRPGTARSAASYAPGRPESSAALRATASTPRPPSSGVARRPATARAMSATLTDDTGGPSMRKILDGSANLGAVRRFELASRSWASQTYRENVARIDQKVHADTGTRIREALDTSTLTEGLLPGATERAVRPRTVGRRLKEHRVDLLDKARDCNYEIGLATLGPDNGFLVEPSASTLR